MVLVLCASLAFAADAVTGWWDGAAAVGSVVGGLVSVIVLLTVAGINGVVLRDLVATRRAARHDGVDEVRVAEVLARRGLVDRLLRGQYARVVPGGGGTDSFGRIDPAMIGLVAATLLLLLLLWAGASVHGRLRRPERAGA